MGSQAAFSSGSHNVIIQVVGDGNTVVSGGQTLDLVPVTDRVKSTIMRDIQILDPVFQAVDIVGREEDLAFLQDWLVTGPKILVTCLIGAAGSGKTRLALELLGQLSEQEATKAWQGGLLTDSEAGRMLNLTSVRRWEWRKPTLMVVDYAGLKGATLRGWLKQLADRGERHEPEYPLRILLLERHADLKSGWYSELAQGQDGERVWDLFGPEEPRRIAPLNEPGQRRVVLRAGLARVAELHTDKAVPKLPEPGADGWFDQRLADGQWENPLLLLMAAIIAGNDGLHAALSLHKPELARKLAGWEAGRLKGRAKDRAEGEMLAHLYACVTLCKGLEREQAVEAADIEMRAKGIQHPYGFGHIVNELARYLGCGEDALPALMPDLLAEALLLEVLGTAGKDSVKRLAGVRPQGIAERLIQTVQDFSVDGYSAAGDPTAMEWMKALVEAGLADLTVALQIEWALSGLPTGTVPLRRLAAEVTEALVGQFRPFVFEAAEWEPRLAGLLNNLSNRQSAMGDRASALESIAEAVGHYRKLAGSNPAAFLPDLALSLNNLSNRQSEMGDRALGAGVD